MEPFQLLKFKSSVLAQQCEGIGKQILNYQKGERLLRWFGHVLILFCSQQRSIYSIKKFT